MSISIGDKVIKRRKELRLTQSDLSENICTQSQISRIEKNDIMPSSETLFLLANRLKVSMDYFFGTEKVSAVIRGKKICEDYLEKKDYETLEVFVDAQLQTVLTDYEYKYFSWVKAVCEGQHSENMTRAMESLEKLTKMESTIKDPELDANIYNSIAIFHYKLGSLEKADEAINRAQYILTENEINNETAIKVYFQYSVILMNEEQYDRSLEFAQRALKICLDKNILYLFSRSIYLICGAKQELNYITEKDRSLYEVGLGIAKLQNDIEMLDLYKSELGSYSI